MVDRLKGTLKADLTALRGEAEGEDQGDTGAGDKMEGTTKVKKPVTPRKRKSKGDAAGDGQGGEATSTSTPARKGRKKKGEEKVVAVKEEVRVKDKGGDE